MAKFYIFGDVETSGLSEQNERLTEIALIKTDEEFNIIDKFEMFVNGERPLSSKIVELTGITEAMIEDAPKYSEAYPLIQDWWNKDITEDDQIIFCAHNAPFDIKFINFGANMILEQDLIIDFIDTVSLARELYPFWKNHKLSTCAEKFGVVNENHHRAMNDTMVLYHIGKRLITEFQQDELDPINFLTKKKLHYKN